MFTLSQILEPTRTVNFFFLLPFDRPAVGRFGGFFPLAARLLRAVVLFTVASLAQSRLGREFRELSENSFFKS
jgi:hypothetical protein